MAPFPGDRRQHCSLRVQAELEFEVDPALKEAFVLLGVKTEELCGSADAFRAVLEGHEETKSEHLLAEVPLVERGAEDDLVEVLQLREGELLGQQFEPDGLIPDLGSKPGVGGGKDARMVEGKWRGGSYREPLCRSGIRSCPDQGVRQLDECEIGDADDPFPRVTVEVAEGEQLFEEDVLEAGFPGQFPSGGVIDRLVDPDEPARQGPSVSEGGLGTSDAEHLEVAFIEAEHHAVDGQRRAWGIILEDHREDRPTTHVVGWMFRVTLMWEW